MVTRPDQQFGMENEDIFEEQVFPQYIPTPPEKPLLNNPDYAALIKEYADKEYIDEDSYLKEFGSPQLTDEQINRMFQASDFSSQKKLALAKFGFGLMRPTEKGRIGAAIAPAGAQLAQDLAKINLMQQQEAQQLQKARMTTKLKQQAQALLDKRNIDTMNRQTGMAVAGKEYERLIANDKNSMDLYNAAMKTTMSKFQDYQIEATKPKRVQISTKDSTGKLSEPFDAVVVQSIREDGTLSGPQYYRPTAQGYQLIDNPEGVVTSSITSQWDKDDYGSGTAGNTTFNDILSGLQTKDSALITLDLMDKSFRDKPSRAGFIAGLQKRFQSMAQIFSDAYSSQFNEFFQSESYIDPLTNKKVSKLQNLASAIELALEDPELLAQVDAGLINKEDFQAILDANKAFDQLGVLGRTEMEKMLGPRIDGKFTVGTNKQSGFFEFEGTDGRTKEEERDLIYSKLKFFDTELPANEVRANNIIYAIARARKSSGRLNLDDIERAAKDLNIYGDSAPDVLTKITELRRQLMKSRQNDLAQIYLNYGEEGGYFERMMALGYDEYSTDRSMDFLMNPSKRDPDNIQTPDANTQGTSAFVIDSTKGLTN